MIEIKGICTDVSCGVETDTLTIKKGKLTSKIKLNAGEADDFSPGDTVTVIIEKEKTLFDKG